MKKFVLISMAVLTLAACQKNVGTAVPDGPTEKESRVPVRFASQVSAAIATKSSGALEAWSGNEKLYVYGVVRDTLNDKILLDNENILINNVSALSPASGTEGNIDVWRVKDTDPKEYFFYRENTYYNFYAYYVDDARTGSPLSAGEPAPVVDETSGTITLPFAITGQEDIMLAHADREADAHGRLDASKFNKSYGAYAARRGVIPTLVFDHQLSRFNFKVKAGNQSTVDHVTIDALTIASRNQATLVIASNDAAVVPGLADTANVVREPLSVQVPRETDKTLTLEEKAFGESILVMPGDKTYDLVLSLKQDNYSVTQTFPVNLKIDFDALKVGAEAEKDSKAVAGHEYDVTLIVYGLDQVDVNVTLTAWKESGSFVINPDI